MAQALSYVGAVPFTVRLTLAGDSWNERLQVTVQLVEATFHSAGVLHPLKPVVQLAPTEGACPPSLLVDTSLDEGIGMTVAYSVALHRFRALLLSTDGPCAVAEDAETVGVNEQTREISCAFSLTRKYKGRAVGQRGCALARG